MLMVISLTKFECLVLIRLLTHHNTLRGGMKMKDKPFLDYFKKKVNHSKSGYEPVERDVPSYIPAGLEPVERDVPHYIPGDLYDETEKEKCMALGIDWGSDITGYDEAEDEETLSARIQEEDRQHKLKLIEICSSYTKEEVLIMCGVFARNYPDVMYEALQDQHRVLSRVNESINELNTCYQKGWI